MAKKKTIIPVTAGKLADAIKTHSVRHTATVKDLVVARWIIQQNIEKLCKLEADIVEDLSKFSLADIESQIGINALLQINGTTNVYFREDEVVVSEIDKKGIDGLGKLLDPKYIVTKTSFNSKLAVDHALDGTLDPMLAKYVSAHKEIKTVISSREVKKMAKACSTVAGSVTCASGDENE